MNFDYGTEIEKIFDKLTHDIERIVNSIECVVDEEDFDTSAIMSDIMYDISRAEIDVTKHVNTDVVDDVVYQMDDLNSMDEEELMDAVKADKNVYQYIINRTENIENLYKFLYEL